MARFSAEFVAGFLKDVSAVSGDFIDGVIRIAILEANVRHLAADADTARRYAEFAAPVPDDLRRPASINAIAASLGLPFETTRRRIRTMSERGLCSTTAEGVVLKEGQLVSSDIERLATSTYANLGGLYRNLRDFAPEVELLAPGDSEARLPGSPPQQPVRLTFRATVGYVLRFLESSRPLGGDFLNSILFLGVVVANVRHITFDPDSSARFGAPGTVVPDDERRRISVQALARSMGLAFETTRRRVNILIDAGLCARDAHGIYVPADVMRSPELATHRATDAAALQRLFTGLARLGVRFD